MPSEADGLSAVGADALAAGDWQAARDAFRAALDLVETAEALLGLAEALWWLGEIHDAAAYRERAYAEFCRRPDPAQAAECALVLCIHYRANLGNAAASAGWLARARRLVEEVELDELRGWLLLMSAGEVRDPIEGERLARDARKLAVESRDLDLELCALAEVGAALVRQGRVKEGLASLDEAMAGSLGGPPCFCARDARRVAARTGPDRGGRAPRGGPRGPGAGGTGARRDPARARGPQAG